MFNLLLLPLQVRGTGHHHVHLFNKNMLHMFSCASCFSSVSPECLPQGVFLWNICADMVQQMCQAAGAQGCENGHLTWHMWYNGSISAFHLNISKKQEIYVTVPNGLFTVSKEKTPQLLGWRPLLVSRCHGSNLVGIIL